MNVYLHDERSNAYLSAMFWSPLLAYAEAKGHLIARVDNTDGLRDCAVMVHGDKLSPSRIRQLRDQNVTIICWDINDSSYMSSSFIHSPEQNELSLIFKVSGIPKQNEVNEVNLDRNFQIKISREKYLPDEQWQQFSAIRHKIKPLPYVLWHPLVGRDAPVVPQKDRSGKVLIRGGNHFWRVILAFRLMQDGLLDERSEFHTSAYFSNSMERRFQYCNACKREKREHGMSLYDSPTTPERRAQCTNPVTGWELPGEFFGGPMFGRHEHGLYNNKCPHSFFFLAKEFERLRGPLDKGFLQRLFNGGMRPQEDFVRDLSRASYAGDAKWTNTVNLPPRFWEAASVGTPSYYMARTEDQDYWPHVNLGEHYFSYREEMMGLHDVHAYSSHSSWWSDVSAAVKALYEDKIRGTDYAVSNALLEYMMKSIEEVCA